MRSVGEFSKRPLKKWTASSGEVLQPAMVLNMGCCIRSEWLLAVET